MEGTRLRILQLLQKNNADTVEGLARAIGLAPATIRRHLDILQRDRLVAFGEVRKKTGRPEYSFFLTEDGQEALPKDYELLLGMLVNELADLSAEEMNGRDGTRVLELLFQRLSASTWSQYKDQVEGKGLGERLTSLVDLLQQRHFFPEADVADGVLRIRLLNCPFRSLALQNKAVCSFDATLISAMLDMPLDRAACIHDGDLGCMYTAPLTLPQVERLPASIS